MIVLCADDPDSAGARELIGELGAALARITGDSGASSFDPDDVRMPRSLFVLARDGAGALLGCGALRPLDADVGEIKRMYARPGTPGVGAALLAHLERQAATLNYRALWLETRRVNTRAIAYYEKHGYRTIPNYGNYIGRSDAICLARNLIG